MGEDVHVVQYVGRLLAQAPLFGGDKPASFSSRRSSTLLEDVKGKLATKTNSSGSIVSGSRSLAAWRTATGVSSPSGTTNATTPRSPSRSKVVHAADATPSISPSASVTSTSDILTPCRLMTRSERPTYT